MDESPEDDGSPLLVSIFTLKRFLVEVGADRDSSVKCACGICGFVIKSRLDQDLSPLVEVLDGIVMVHPTSCFTFKGYRKSLVKALLLKGKGCLFPLSSIHEEGNDDFDWISNHLKKSGKKMENISSFN
jgi:hypothetical protein